MLEFQHVTFQYDSEDFNIIDDLSFTVEPEEFISIIGISGCGKSTIFKLTNGLYTDSIAIVDPEKAEMVSLERIPGMKEEVCGWLDDDRLLIAGTLDGESYFCVYDLG